MLRVQGKLGARTTSHMSQRECFGIYNYFAPSIDKDIQHLCTNSMDVGARCKDASKRLPLCK